jgi:hypothetical protein
VKGSISVAFSNLDASAFTLDIGAVTPARLVLPLEGRKPKSVKINDRKTKPVVEKGNIILELSKGENNVSVVLK